MSLKRRAILWITGFLAVFCLFAAALSAVFVMVETNEHLDSQLLQIAVHSSDLLGASVDAIDGIEEEDRLSIQYRKKDGLVRSIGPEGVPALSSPGFADIEAGGRGWRVFTTSSNGETFQVAQRWSARYEIVVLAAIGALLPLLVAIPVAWLTIRMVVNRAFASVSRLSGDLAQRSVSASTPIPLDQVPVEFKEAATAFNDLIERYRKALEQQRRLVADAAHELRTPLAAIQIQTDAIAVRLADDQGKDSLAELRGGVRRASMLIGQLLQLARADTDASVSLPKVEIGELISELIADHVRMAEARTIDLGLSETRDAGATMMIDIGTRSLFENLLVNALKYTHAGGSVDMLLHVDEAGAVLQVMDTGPGLSPEAKDRLYERFFRDASPGIEGSGLGLSIAKAIADRHGFGLSVDNRSDTRGTLARVTVPRQRA